VSIKYISAAWQTALTGFPPDQRVYVDFRQQEYPELAGAPTFTLITSADNQPGSHNLTGGYANYFLDMPSKMVLDIYCKPTFSYTGGTNQYLWTWYNDATHQLALYFDVTAHKYTLAWQDGGTMRTQVSSAYGSDVAFQVWTRITVSLDLTTGTVNGSALYIQGASVSTAWSGASDTKARYFPVFTVRGQNGTAGGYTINYCRLFFGITATASEVSANFSAKLDEEVIWHYNGHAVGHTRCNVTGRVRNVALQKTIESGTGNSNPNQLGVILMSTIGQFADDQYAAFAPASEIYNGTSSQKYMQKRTPIELETWYGGLFELEFSGRVDDTLWKRRSVIDDVSTVTLSALDRIDDLKRSLAPVSYTYENYDLSKPGDYSTSLLHTIVRLCTRKSWYNFLGNSSFENATIANSWLVAGAGATFSRVAGGLIGSFQGDLVYGAAAASVYQIVTFTGIKKIDTQQVWNFSIYLKSAAAASGTLRISGYTGGVETEFQTQAYALTGGEGWRKFEVSYTVATSTVNAIRCTWTKAEAGTLSADCAMLIQRSASVNWFALNSTDGAAGSISSDSAMNAYYDSIGFDTDDAAITHPWVLINQNDTLMSHLEDIADATAATYLGMDSCGTLKYRTPFKAGYADPASIATITSMQEVSAIMDITQANHIIIHGIQIIKSTFNVILWNAKNTGSFSTVNGADIYESVVAGASWPNTTTYPEYWAKLSETN
jgi:hypothetical protein